VGRLGLGVGVKTSIVMLRGGEIAPKCVWWPGSARTHCMGALTVLPRPHSWIMGDGSGKWKEEGGEGGREGEEGKGRIPLKRPQCLKCVDANGDVLHRFVGCCHFVCFRRKV